MNFSTTKCKLLTALSDGFDFYARLSIQFSQLMMNISWCIAICFDKPNNCTDFALCGSAQQELHYNRLPRLSIRCLCTHAWMKWESGGNNTCNSVVKSHTNSSTALWRPYFWNRPCTNSETNLSPNHIFNPRFSECNTSIHNSK